MNCFHKHFYGFGTLYVLILVILNALRRSHQPKPNNQQGSSSWNLQCCYLWQMLDGGTSWEDWSNNINVCEIHPWDHTWAAFFFFFSHTRRKRKRHHQPPSVAIANTNNILSPVLFIMQSVTPAVLTHLSLLMHTHACTHSLPLPNITGSDRRELMKTPAMWENLSERMEKTRWISSDKTAIKRNPFCRWPLCIIILALCLCLVVTERSAGATLIEWTAASCTIESKLSIFHSPLSFVFSVFLLAASV